MPIGSVQGTDQHKLAVGETAKGADRNFQTALCRRRTAQPREHGMNSKDRDGGNQEEECERGW